MRTELGNRRAWRCITLVAAALSGSLALAPATASAQNLFDFLFGGLQKQQARQGQPQQNTFDPFGLNQQQQQQQAPAPRVAGSGPAFCVRSCDGKYFPLTQRAGATPVALCQAFCPASATKVYYGGSIDYAASLNGERYADAENAFAYRKELRADCTCNGRDPAGLAPVDIATDGSLRAGDVVATAEGLVAYTGVKVGANLTADFAPVASYPGLTAELRARLGEMKVAPANTNAVNDAPPAEAKDDASAPVSTVPKSAAPAKPKRAEVH